MIIEVVSKLDFKEDDLELYGKYKVKINFFGINCLKDNVEGYLILVIFINLILVGEGKLIIIVGLGDVFNKINKKFVIVLWEFLFGFVMGIKGGVVGGGYV